MCTNSLFFCSQVTLTVRGRKDSKVITVKASESLKKMILSPNVSPDVKQLLINGLIHEQMSHSETNESAIAPGLTEPVNSVQTGSLEPVNTVQTGSSTTTSFPESSDHGQTGTSVSNTKSLEETSSLNFKAWKENEEKLLIDTRHQMNNMFKRSRNHVVLWKQVSEKLLETLNCRVTYQQCMYKYNALKKKWKEVIDSPSGSETKHFTHKDEFDQLYGTNASTKPQYTIDTDKTERKRQQEHVSSEDDNTPMPTPPTKSKYKSCKKTRQQDIPSILEQQHSEFVNRMTKMHDDKMQRYDKFLDLMSKKLSEK